MRVGGRAAEPRSRTSAAAAAALAAAGNAERFERAREHVVGGAEAGRDLEARSTRGLLDVERR